jgi:Tfp pilus assembly protein PilO
MNKKMISMLLIIVLALAAWVLLFLMPLQTRKKQLDQEHERLTALRSRRVSVLEVQRLRSEADSLETRINESMERIFKGDQLLEMGRIMERIGSEYGLKLASITPDYGSLSIFRESDQISNLPVQMKFEGAFNGLAGFLDNFDQFPFIINIEAVSVTRTDPYQNHLNIDLQCIVVINNKREDRSAAASAS